MESFSCWKETCPWCGAKGGCRPHGTYTRSIIDFSSGKPKDSTLTVLRVICSSCGHTHAILPDSLIPYDSYSLFFILRVLAEYFSSTSTVRSICERFWITPSMLYRWKALFFLHKRLWLGVLEDAACAPAEFLSRIGSLPSFSGEFGCRFVLLTAFSFLQSHKNPADYRQCVF